MTTPDAPIARLRELAEETETTPRPWIVSRRELYTLVQTGLGGQPYSFANVAGGLRTIDAELLVAAVNALPDLLAAVEAAYGIAENAQPIRETSLTQAARGEPGKVVGWVVDCNVIEVNRRALDKLYRPAGGEEAGQ